MKNPLSENAAVVMKIRAELPYLWSQLRHAEDALRRLGDALARVDEAVCYLAKNGGDGSPEDTESGGEG